MSEKERQNSSGEEHGCDEQVDNSEVEKSMSDLDNTAEVSPNSSRITVGNLQHHVVEGAEVDPDDVIIIKELSHESLRGQISGENLECTVIYEFPKEYESESVNHLSPTHIDNAEEISYNNNSQVTDQNDYSSAPEINKKVKDMVGGKVPLNIEVPHFTSFTGISGVEERKRKVPISFMQNKRQKEIQSPSKFVIQLPHKNEDIVQIACGDSDSDQFADSENSSSSNDTSSSDTKESNTASSSQNNKSINKETGKKVFTPYLRGETIAPVKFPIETKKFEISMATILEVPESESDDQISQPPQFKPNPLKMKTKVVKRKDKCNICNVRLGLCAIRCRCGGYYCAKHRYDKEHNCTFDYKAMGAEEIRKNNPRITAEKVRKL